MHKGPKYIQTLWAIRKKFLLCKTTTNARYVRSLSKKPHYISGTSQRLKKVLRVLRGAKITPQRPKKVANPLRLSQQNVYSVESLQFCP